MSVILIASELKITSYMRHRRPDLVGALGTALMGLGLAGYGLATHKGYPTPEHCRALKTLGALPIHRRSFARVREALGLDPIQTELFAAEEEMAEEIAMETSA